MSPIVSRGAYPRRLPVITSVPSPPPGVPFRALIVRTDADIPGLVVSVRPPLAPPPPTTHLISSAAIVTLGDLAMRRAPLASGGQGGGGTAHTFVELYGGTMVPCLHYEPDPTTFRDSYYYHTVLNVLYRKIITRNRPDLGIIRAYWKQVSQG